MKAAGVGIQGSSLLKAEERVVLRGVKRKGWNIQERGYYQLCQVPEKKGRKNRLVDGWKRDTSSRAQEGRGRCVNTGELVGFGYLYEEVRVFRILAF